MLLHRTWPAMSVNGKLQSMPFICPECKTDLAIINDRYLQCKNQHKFDIVDGVYNFLPVTMHPITQLDALYHNAVKENYIDMHQIETYKNLYYRWQIQDFIKQHSNDDTNILELGGGAGYDMQLFHKHKTNFKNYYFSEIGINQVRYVKNNIKDPRFIWCSIDGRAIPFTDQTLGIVYMMAALHHLPELDESLTEITRAIKPLGYMVCGYEPNRLFSTYFKRLSKFSRRFLPTKGHSAADDEVAEGFTLESFQALAERHNLRLLHVEPIWLMCGFAHYGLEFIYRLLRLKKRIRLPNWIEKGLIALDCLIFKLPGFKHISWSYTAIFQKNC